MKPFSKKEWKLTALILAFIVLISAYNFNLAIKKGRDVTRKNDLFAAANALDKYSRDFGFFPLSSNSGEIRACIQEGLSIDEFVESILASREDEKVSAEDLFEACTWGEDNLEDVTDENYPDYLSPIPADPLDAKEIQYFYFSNGRRFQLLAHLEWKNQDEYDEQVEQRGIYCGAELCNFGRASGSTPINRSIEQYEAELLEKKK